MLSNQVSVKKIAPIRKLVPFYGSRAVQRWHNVELSVVIGFASKNRQITKKNIGNFNDLDLIWTFIIFFFVKINLFIHWSR